jgi:hypothetical protein
MTKYSHFYDFLLVESLWEKYGKGENFIRKCQTCDYEKTIHTGGVHCSEGGSFMVYDEEEELYCPNCDFEASLGVDHCNGKQVNIFLFKVCVHEPSWEC